MKKKKVMLGNMRIGTRFMYEGHSSLMIATDLRMVQNSLSRRLCVSENGLVEWIDVTFVGYVAPQTINIQILGTSSEFIKNFMEGNL